MVTDMWHCPCLLNFVDQIKIKTKQLWTSKWTVKSMTETDSSRGDIFIENCNHYFFSPARWQTGKMVWAKKKRPTSPVFKYVFVAFPPNSFQHRPKSSSSLAFKASSFRSKLFKPCSSLCNTITNCLDEKMLKIPFKVKYLISFLD